MNFIIIADKFQKRMKSKGCVGLIDVNNKYIIQYQHRFIKKYYPKANIVYVYGFESKKLLSFFKKNQNLANDFTLLHNKNYENFNNAYSLFLAKEFLDSECFLLFGDNLLNNNIFDKFNSKLGSQIFLSHKNKNRLGCIIQDNRVESISFDLDNYLCDMYYLTRVDAKSLKNIIMNSQYHNNFLFELMNKLIDNELTFQPYFIDKSRVMNGK